MIRIECAAPVEYESALRLLFHRSQPDDRRSSISDLLRAAGQRRISFGGLLTAKDGGNLLGAVLYVLQEDRTAFVWPPGVHPDRDDVSDALLRQVIERIKRGDAWIGQCLIARDAAEDRRTLSRN